MSVELNNQSQPGNVDLAVINEQIVNDDSDAALEAIWNKNERDNGAERDGGKFVSPDPEKRAEAEPLEGGEGEGQPDSSTPAAVPLPANWQGMDEVWGKLPAEDRAKLAVHQADLHARMSDQGRQLAGFKPIAEIIEKNGKYFNGSIKGADGNPVTPAQGIEYLFNVQQAMDANPVDTILSIADRYGARDKLAAALGQPAPQGDQALRQEIAGLKQQLSTLVNPATIDERINRKLQEQADAKAAGEEVSRLAKDKPLFSDIPEKRMVNFINDAWDRLGSTASKEAVFNLAYDMAVNADPDLRAKAAAAKAPAVTDPKKLDGAKRANGVNVTSTSSGKGRALTEDEELELVFDKNQKG